VAAPQDFPLAGRLNQRLRWPTWTVLSVLFTLGIAYWVHGLRVQQAQVGTGKIMLAVMPFANLSGDSAVMRAREPAWRTLTFPMELQRRS